MISHPGYYWPGTQPTMSENPQPTPAQPQQPPPPQQQFQQPGSQQLPRTSYSIHNSASLLLQIFEEEKTKVIQPYRQRIRELEASLNEYQLRARLGSPGGNLNNVHVPVGTPPASSPGSNVGESATQNAAHHTYHPQNHVPQSQPTPPDVASHNAAQGIALLSSSGLEYQLETGTLRYHGPWAELAQRVVMESRPGISPDELGSFMEPNAFGGILDEYLDVNRGMKEKLKNERDEWRGKYEQLVLALNEHRDFQAAQAPSQLPSENPVDTGEFQSVDELMATMTNIS